MASIRVLKVAADDVVLGVVGDDWWTLMP